jgi:hypothetical protein
LKGRDKTYLAKMSAHNAELAQVESDSYQFTQKEKEQIPVFLSAVLSIELLSLAERMADTARKLPFQGTMTGKVKKDIAAICKDARHLTSSDVPEAAQIEFLDSMIGGDLL